MLQEMRTHAEAIFDVAVRAVDPEEAIRSHLAFENDLLQIGGVRISLTRYRRVLGVGAGKADAPMAKALERLSAGLIVVKEGHALPLATIAVQEAGHPVPDARGVQGTEKILALVDNAGEQDLIFCVISGGGSALLVAPAEGVTLPDKQEVTRLLLACGATIHEINAVRKHLSRVKGGELARRAYPATVVSLMLSDVVGDDLDVIASGPTIPDSSTFVRAKEVLERYRIWDRVPTSVRRRLEQGIRDEIPETPKAGDKVFERCHYQLVGTNLQALTAAGEKAATLGYRVLILSAGIEGETREIAKAHAAIAKEVVRSENPIPPPACILSGGETTVTLQGDGKGGRNQEFVLAAALALNKEHHIVVLSGGTDGNDGPTNAAGAVADEETLPRAYAAGLDPSRHLAQNDAYPFFAALGDLLITGPTRTNVMDVRIMLVDRPRR
jgi:glycerate 2-kinase